VLVLILLPPSEGKTSPRRGRPLDLSSLTSPSLTAVREHVLAALVEVSTSPGASAHLGLTPGLADEITRNLSLRSAPTMRADRVYTGVLYELLSFDTLSAAAKRRATTRVAITSSLFGLVRPADRIPAYRLSGDVSLPGLGPVAGIWRAHLGAAVREAMGGGLLIDLRSTMYAAFWRPPPELASRVATVRVLHEVNGERKVVSHFNKATKGRIVRALLEDGGKPRTPAALADLLRDLGWKVEEGTPDKRGTQLDVVVDSVLQSP
jgi:cytoplasmic iron level regulating protein YaaA (DUF328/UPF0246 family)